MTVDDKKLETFHVAVAKLFAEKMNLSHYPRDDCFSGMCSFCMTRYSWSALRGLVAAFWKAGGSDINDDWREIAEHAGFEPDDLHGIMLGIFVGGDRPGKNKRRGSMRTNPFLRNIS